MRSSWFEFEFTFYTSLRTLYYKYNEIFCVWKSYSAWIVSTWILAFIVQWNKYKSGLILFWSQNVHSTFFWKQTPFSTCLYGILPLVLRLKLQGTGKKEKKKKPFLITETSLKCIWYVPISLGAFLQIHNKQCFSSSVLHLLILQFIGKKDEPQISHIRVTISLFRSFRILLPNQYYFHVFTALEQSGILNEYLKGWYDLATE